MSLTAFPNGISSFGVPVLSSQFVIPQTLSVGNYWFVNSAGGTNGAGDGTSPSQPLATVAGAISVGSAGDMIVIMEGHAETISSATIIACSKARMKFIGLGVGTTKPTFTYTTAATAAIPVTALGVVWQNCRFVANFADIAGAFTTTAAKYLTLIDCDFIDTDATHNFLAIVKTSTVDNAADGLTLIRATQVSAGLTANTAVLNIGQSLDKMLVQGCTINSLVAGNSGAIYQPTTTKVLTNAEIDSNTFNFVGANAATGALLITTATTHSGMISRNFVTGARAAASAILVTASSGFKFMENYYQTAADKSGILLPANV